MALVATEEAVVVRTPFWCGLVRRFGAEGDKGPGRGYRRRCSVDESVRRPAAFNEGW